MTENERSYEDALGVPFRVLRLSEEFYGAVGRIAALAAIVELRVSNIVVLWGKQPSDEGAPVAQLKGRFKQIKKERLAAGSEMPEALSLCDESLVLGVERAQRGSAQPVAE